MTGSQNLHNPVDRKIHAKNEFKPIKISQIFSNIYVYHKISVIHLFFKLNCVIQFYFFFSAVHACEKKQMRQNKRKADQRK